MSQTLSNALPREQEESFIIYPNKGVIFLVSLLFVLFCGSCFLLVVAYEHVNNLLTIQKWAGGLLIVIIFYCACDLCLIPLRLLLTRSPLLTFTEEGVYNYYRLASPPRFLKWEDVEAMDCVTARRRFTALKISRVPSERESMFRQQRGLTLVLLSDLFYRYAVDIPQWVMPLSVSDLQHQVKQKYARALQQHHIRVSMLNLDSGEKREY